MNPAIKELVMDNDPEAASRKGDHIALAFDAQVQPSEIDPRFWYEPFLAANPNEIDLTTPFLNKTLKVPIWVSSMTGGTEKAKHINHNLARACNEFGMGMGLGSCRSLLFSNEYLADFHVRPILGPDYPLYANLGIAQVEQLVAKKETERITDLIDKLQADGLIIHVNPLQEFMQPEGDQILVPPIDTIETILQTLNISVIVKEVGQGFGKDSLAKLLQLPLQAIDFAASGGTNFALLELLRDDTDSSQTLLPLTKVGHSAAEMVELTNQLLMQLGSKAQCRQIIVSGGIHSFLDGFYLTKKLTVPAVYGQASGFLKYAMKDYEQLRAYILKQIKGLRVANAYLIPK